MQSGNFAVMGFWNRERMDQIWNDAVQAAGFADHANPLEAMRMLPANYLVLLPSMDVSHMFWTSKVKVTSSQVNGFGVFVDNHFVSPPLFGPDGEFYLHDIPVEAVMHGDNGDEGNIFREPAARPGALEDLRKTATAILGKENCQTFLRLYGLDKAEELSDKERDWRLHRIPEDARFYLPSAELQRVWPKAAFYHLSAKSPFTTSRYASDSYHTLDLLYVRVT